MLMPAPTKLPWRTSYGATFTWSCSRASSETGATPVRSPGCPASPNELLKYEPSIVMLLSRLSWPANEKPKDIGLYWGVSRRRSSTRRLMVGRWAICVVEMVVAAPVRSALNTGLLVAVTMTGSNSTLARPSTKRRSAVPPNVSWIWSCTSRRWPTMITLTRYGPPTRIPGMVNLPSARVTAAYAVPDGPCPPATNPPVIDRHAQQDDQEGEPRLTRVRPQRVPEYEEAREHEQERDHRIAEHTHRPRYVGASPAQHEHRRRRERIEREDRHHELVGQLLERADQHEADPQARGEHDRRRGRLVLRVDLRDGPKEQPVVRHGEEDAGRRENRPYQRAEGREHHHHRHRADADPAQHHLRGVGRDQRGPGHLAERQQIEVRRVDEQVDRDDGHGAHDQRSR